MKNIKASYCGCVFFLLVIIVISCVKEKKENETGKMANQGAATGVSLATDNAVFPDSAEGTTTEKIAGKAVIDENYILQASMEDILADIRWYNAGSGREMLAFHRDLTWTLTDWFGLGEFVKGSYIVRDDSVVVLDLSDVEYSYAAVISGDSYAADALKNTLGGESELSFVLQRDYRDFYAVGRLYNAQFDKTFRSAAPSPENGRYELDGIMVTKKSGQITIEETLFTKKAPFDDAEEFSMLFANRFGGFTQYLIDIKMEVNVVLPGEVFDYDALYTAENNKVWYRIKIDNSMTYENEWIYG
jgi:hypothetical protein